MWRFNYSDSQIYSNKKIIYYLNSPESTGEIFPVNDQSLPEEFKVFWEKIHEEGGEAIIKYKKNGVRDGWIETIHISTLYQFISDDLVVMDPKRAEKLFGKSIKLPFSLLHFGTNYDKVISTIFGDLVKMAVKIWMKLNPYVARPSNAKLTTINEFSEIFEEYLKARKPVETLFRKICDQDKRKNTIERKRTILHIPLLRFEHNDYLLEFC